MNGRTVLELEGGISMKLDGRTGSHSCTGQSCTGRAQNGSGLSGLVRSR